MKPPKRQKLRVNESTHYPVLEQHGDINSIPLCTDRGSFCQTSTSLQTNTGKTSGTADTVLSHVMEEHNYFAASRERRLASKKRPKKTPGFNCAQVSNMRTEIKQLRSEICRLKRNGSFISRLKNAQKVSESVAFQKALNKMTKPSQLFLNMQLQSVKKSKGRHFTTPEKILCLSIYKKKTKCISSKNIHTAISKSYEKIT